PLGQEHLDGHRPVEKLVTPQVHHPHPPSAQLTLQPVLAVEQLGAFRREASALASVRDEHVVGVYSFGQHHQQPFFVMEFVRGAALGAIIAQHTRHGTFVPLHRAMTILTQVARGLSAVHRAGVLHRDVKPDNILIEEGTGRPVLIDFGLVNLLRGNRIEGNAEGTPDYMAPEVWQPMLGPVTHATDVYALGCTAYELLAGRPPFHDVTTVPQLMSSHMMRQPTPLATVRPEVAAFDPVLRRAMAKDPAERLGDPQELTAALGEAAPQEARPQLASLPGLPLPLQPTTERPGGRGPVRILVIDDDPIFQKVIARAAQIAFYDTPPQIVTVGSGTEALTQAAQNPPDLVLLDYNMPELNGLDTLSRLRALKNGAQARVLVVSGSARTLERWPFAVLGVQDFYDKTGGLPPLVALIGQVAEQIGLRPKTS
ncbi:MAG: response regulator, partial [Myxococcales bacterium]